MAQIFLACSKCEQPIPVDREMVMNSLALTGVEPPVHHDVCPGEERPPPEEAPAFRRFAVSVMVAEVWPEGDEAYEALEVTPADIQWRAPTLGGITLDVFTHARTVIEAANYPTVMHGPMSSWLEDTWGKAVESSMVADLPSPPPA